MNIVYCDFYKDNNNNKAIKNLMNIKYSSNSQGSNFQNSILSSLKDSKNMKGTIEDTDRVPDNLVKEKSLSNLLKKATSEKPQEELENNIYFEKIVRK
jgi:hypothetical protein